jgi:hypothetical protein
MSAFSEPSLGGHQHVDKRGYVHWCYHQCKHRWYLWIPLGFILQSIAVPLEHEIARWFWTLPYLNSVSNWLGWPLT